MAISRSIFLRFSGPSIDQLQAIRQTFDPLFTKLEPHVTLVFPFDSEIPSQAINPHVTDIARPYDAIQFTRGNELVIQHNTAWIPITFGGKAIDKLHAELHVGLLGPFLDKSRPYQPHVTIARNIKQHAAQSLQTSATALFGSTFTANELIVEKITHDETSVIESVVQLGPPKRY